MTIRPAVQADVPHLVDLGRAFRRALYAESVAENVDQMTATARQLIDHLGVIFVADDRGGALVGMIGLVLHDHFLSGARTVSEAFFYVDPAHRGTVGVRLLKRALAWAGAQDAAILAMIQPVTEPRVGDLYAALGFQRIEVGWQRAVPAGERAA